MYSTGKPRSRSAITICSLSALFTRGSLAPWTTRSGALILAAEFSGDCLWSWARPAGVFGFPVWRNGIEQRDEIGWPYYRYARRVHVRSEREARQRGVAAVRSPQNSHSFRIDGSLRNEVADAVGDVILHLLAPLVVPRVEEFLAVA